MRLAGASYEEIAKAGGGILSTVRATRAASEEDLVASALRRLDALIAEGVTTIEVKSGYGLETAAERKSLRAARQLADRRPVFDPRDAARRACAAAGIRGQARGLSRQGRRARRSRRSPGKTWSTRSTHSASASPSPRPKSRASSTPRGASGCRSSCTPTNCRTAAGRRSRPSSTPFRPITSNMRTRRASKRWRRAGVVAVLLPGAFYTLRERQAPPVALFRKHRVPIAVATDSNPGTSPLTSILLTLNMAATLFGLTVEECIRGVTRHAAAALGLYARDGDARGRQMGGSGDLGGRAAGRARLPSRLQSPLCPCLEGPMTVMLRPGEARLGDWRAIWRGSPVALDPAARAKVAASAAAVQRILARGEPVYGINTGFGKLSAVRIERGRSGETSAQHRAVACRRRRRDDARFRSRGS